MIFNLTNAFSMTGASKWCSVVWLTCALAVLTGVDSNRALQAQQAEIPYESTPGFAGGGGADDDNEPPPDDDDGGVDDDDDGMEEDDGDMDDDEGGMEEDEEEFDPPGDDEEGGTDEEEGGLEEEYEPPTGDDDAGTGEEELEPPVEGDEGDGMDEREFYLPPDLPRGAIAIPPRAGFLNGPGQNFQRPGGGFSIFAAGPPGGITPTVGTGIEIDDEFTGTDLNDEFGLLSPFIPPDTMGSVGPNHVVELINGAFAIYPKDSSGVPVVPRISLEDFWRNTLPGFEPTGFAFDPRIIYDHQSNHWFACAVDNAGAPNNFLLAVSDDDDPTGDWYGFQIDSDGANNHWADFPMMGVDADGVYITAHMFPLDPDESFEITIFSFPKADLIPAMPMVTAPSIANRTEFQRIGAFIPGEGTLTSPQPSVDFGPSDGEAELLGIIFNSSGTLALYEILNPAAAGATLVGPTLIPTGLLTPNPPLADQPFPGPDNVQTGDRRFSGNVFQTGGSLWAVHCVNVLGRPTLQWYEVDEDGSTVFQAGNIFDPDLDLYFPSIAVNSNGCVVVGCTGSSDTVPMSSYVAAGSTTSGVTTFGPVSQTHLGNGTYLRFDGSFRNRWGDYSATVLDPNGTDFWTFQEIVDGTDNWAVRITEILEQAPTTPQDFLKSGFNDTVGINEDSTANSPFTLNSPLNGQGGAEPGWAGPWSVTSGAANVVSGVAGIEGDGTAAFFQGDSEARRVFGTPLTNPLYVDFRIMIPGAITNSVVMGVVDNDLLANIANATAAQVQVLSDFSVHAFDGPVLEPTGMFLTPGTFHHLRVRVDPTTQTYDLFIDGMPFSPPDPLDFRGNPIDIDAVRYRSNINNPDGSYLDAVCVSRNGSPYLVTDQDGGHVTVFNGDTNRVSDTVVIDNASAGLYGCAVTVDGSLGFVFDFGFNVWVIDLSDRPRLARGTNPIPISNLGESGAVTCDGKFLVVCDGSATQPVSVVDIANRVEIDTFSTGFDNSAVALCDDGSVLVTSFNARRVTRLMIDSNGMLTATGESLSFGGPPIEVCCAPGGVTGIVILGDANRAVSFLVDGMFQIDNRVLQGTFGLGCAICSDGSALYTRSNDDQFGFGIVSRYDYNGFTGGIGASPTFSVGVELAFPFFGLESLVVNRDCTLVYVPEAGTTRATNAYNATSGFTVATVFDGNNGEPTGICCVPPCDPPTLPSPAASPYLVTEFQGNDVTVFDGDTNQLTGTVRIPNPGPLGLYGCCVAPDATLGFVTNGTNEIWLVDITTGVPRVAAGVNPIIVSTNIVKQCVVTCDGQYLLCCGGPGTAVISVVDIATRTEVSRFQLNTGIACTEVEICHDGQTVLAVGTDRVLRRLTLAANGTLTDTLDRIAFTKHPMNVCCEPGSQSGVIVLTGNDYSEPGELVSFTLPGMQIADTRPLTGGVAFSCAICCDGSRVVARSQTFQRDTGFVDIFNYTPATGAFSLFPTQTIGVAAVPYAAPGVNHLVTNDDCTLVYVPQATGSTNAYNISNGTLAAQIFDAENFRPFGIACPPCCPAPAAPLALFVKNIVDGPDLDGNNVADLVIPVAASAQPTYTYQITIRQPDIPLSLVEDVVPSQWELLSCTAGHDGDLVNTFPGNLVGGRRETMINWLPTDNDSTLQCEIRLRPGVLSGRAGGALFLEPAQALDTTGGAPLYEGRSSRLVTNRLSLVGMSDGNGDGLVDLTGNGDEDGDLLSDWLEAGVLGTDPHRSDSDGDGVTDMLDLSPLNAGVW